MNITSYKSILPEKRVVFLGGHQNMTKKLRQLFPKWIFISDSHLKRNAASTPDIVFYWTNHSSHKLMQYIYSKLSPDIDIAYVTSTNINLLLEEMQSIYLALHTRQPQ